MMGGMESQQLTGKGQATRERIVRAAAELMIRNGVAGTSTPAIRDAAGVSSSQIYHYFADKEALTRAVIEYDTLLIVGNQERLLIGMDSLDALHAWRDVVVRTIAELGYVGGCPLGSLSSELADQDPGARAALSRSFVRWADAIRTGLTNLVDSGVLRPDADPDRLSRALLAALQGGLLLAQAQRDTSVLEAGLDVLIQHVEQYAS